MVSLTPSSCASLVHLPENVSDIEWCHPFKTASGQDVGASCDMFLTSSPQLLDELAWQAKQAQWLSFGGVIECTTSNSMINLKVFVEDTCSQVTCDEATKEVILQSLDRIAALGAM